MREVILAKSAGFCFGVKRAVDTVYEQSERKNVYTFGPIIHNEEVVKDLEKKGVKVINLLKELENVKEISSMTGYVGIASDLIKYDKKYDSVMKSLLGRVVVADNFDHAVKIAKKFKYKFKKTNKSNLL